MATSPSEALAAVDCGTNSTRLLVVGEDGAPAVRRMKVTRLGQGVDATGKLDPEAVERTVAVLVEYRKVMDDHRVRRARMAATSAVRDAVNGRDFLDRATTVSGVRAELLSGEEEGRLAYAGASAGLPAAVGDDVVVDIGGGSTELVVGRGPDVRVVSMELGCVRLAERCFRHDPPSSGDVAAAEALIGGQLDRAVEVVPVLGSLRPASRLIGLAGTVSTLSALDQGLADYDFDRLHHSVLSRRAVERWCDILAAEPSSARAERPGMAPGREDVIVAGALVLREVMARLGFETCLVSETDILDGLVASLRR